MALTPLTQKHNKRWQVWLKQSYFDLYAAKSSLDNDFYEWATYQSEQAAEKALKAYLVHGGYRPPKVHKIALLLSMCDKSFPEFKHIDFEFQTLEGFTFISRYPFLVPGLSDSPHEYITREDAVACISEAQDIYNKIYKLLYDERIPKTHTK